MEGGDHSVGGIISDNEARPLLFVKIGSSGCDRKVGWKEEMKRKSIKKLI